MLTIRQYGLLSLMVLTCFVLFGCATRQSVNELQTTLTKQEAFLEQAERRDSASERELATLRVELEQTRESLRELERELSQVPGEPVEVIVQLSQDMLPENRIPDSMPVVRMRGTPYNSREIRVYTDTVSISGTGVLYANPGEYDLTVRTFQPVMNIRKRVVVDAKPPFRETIYLAPEDWKPAMIIPQLSLGPQAKAAGVEGVLIERQALNVKSVPDDWNAEDQLLFDTFLTEDGLRLAQTYIVEGEGFWRPGMPSGTGRFEQMTGEYRYRFHPVRMGKTDELPGFDEALVPIEGLELKVEITGEGGTYRYGFSPEEMKELVFDHQSPEESRLIVELP